MPSKEYQLVIVRSARKEMVALPTKISVQVQRQGESKIRRWILASNWLDAIVVLPDQALPQH